MSPYTTDRVERLDNKVSRMCPAGGEPLRRRFRRVDEKESERDVGTRRSKISRGREEGLEAW